jgi:hypothetical protein
MIPEGRRKRLLELIEEEESKSSYGFMRLHEISIDLKKMLSNCLPSHVMSLDELPHIKKFLRGK